MIATDTLFQRRDVLLAADTTTLAPAADPPFIRLSMEAFTPSVGTVVADIVAPTFDGYGDILCAVGAQLQSIDPVDGDSQIEIKAPLGGWRWETTGVTNLPMSIFGWAQINDAETIVFGSELFDEPIILTGVNQSITIPVVKYSTPPGSMQ